MYTSIPTISIIGNNTIPATTSVTISENNLSYSGSSTLIDSKFYVITSDYNVYKCLYNNNNALSTVEPTTTPIEPFTTADGYIWKFMYYIPIGLRKKFISTSYIPVTNVLTSSYYSNGGIDYVQIVNGGSGYSVNTPLKIYTVGDGIYGDFLGKINSTTKEINEVSITNSGVGYYSTTTKILKTVARSANVATITTDTAHNLIAGTPFVVSGTGIIDGSFIVSTVVTNTSFTFASIGSAILTTTFGSVNYTTIHSTAISYIVRANNVVTITTSTAHNLNEGNIITIAGATGFNGVYTIDKHVSSTEFSFYQFGDNTTLSSAGTITQSAIGISDISRLTNVVTVTTLATHNFKPALTISSIIRALNIATVITTTAHKLVAGDTIVITNTTNFNGSVIVASVIDTYSFTFSNVGTGVTETSGYVKTQVTKIGRAHV